LFEAAFISYAVFLALILLAVIVVIAIIAIKALMDYIHQRRHNRSAGGAPENRPERPAG
jgi:hypothetical protein